MCCLAAVTVLLPPSRSRISRALEVVFISDSNMRFAASKTVCASACLHVVPYDMAQSSMADVAVQTVACMCPTCGSLMLPVLGLMMQLRLHACIQPCLQQRIGGIR